MRSRGASTKVNQDLERDHVRSRNFRPLLFPHATTGVMTRDVLGCTWDPCHSKMYLDTCL